MAKFAVVDLHNLYYRAAKGCQGDAFTRSGMALHIAFKTFRKLFSQMECEHIVIATEGRSWRYQTYPEYKAKRRLDKAERSDAEREEDAIIQNALDELIEYLDKKTRMTVLRSRNIEGDDFIARFIALHRSDEHVLLSSDSDFIQLVAPNVVIYDAMLDRLITRDGVTDEKGRDLVFEIKSSTGKISIKGSVQEETEKHRRAEKEKLRENANYEVTPFSWSLPEDWWEHALFVKIIRGDSGDGIFSSYPGVRYKGTKNKIGIIDAWNDRKTKGFEWNNFMQQTWDKLTSETDDDNQPIMKSVTVKEEMDFNRSLIDLTAQPQWVVDEMDTKIVEEIQKPAVRDIGINFLKFCGRHQLVQLSTEAAFHAQYLNAGYPMAG